MTEENRATQSINEHSGTSPITGKPEATPKKLWVVIVTWAIRLLVGATFIFSGYVKGIDPWGTVYKVNDYLAVMGISVWPTLVSAGVIAMCIFEFLIGVFILLGCFRRSAPLLGLLFMCVMLPLTAWIWATHPVSDCGCFGDAFIISDAATFWKNVALTAGFIWLLRRNRDCRCLVTPYLQWVAAVVSGLFLFVISEIGWLSQPLVDYRPFPVGTPIAGAGNEYGEDESEPEYEFVYRRGDEERVVGENDSLPSEEEGWSFVETREITSGSGNGTSSEGLRIWDGDKDVSDEYLSGEGPKLWLMMPRLGEVSISETWQINAIHQWCEEHGVDMYAVVNGSPSEIEDWKDLSLSEYPIFTAEDTAIKEIVRGKVALVYTVDGEIVWKNTLRAAWRPAFDPDDESEDVEPIEDLRELKENDGVLLRNLWMIYLAVMAVLIAMSASSGLVSGFRARLKRN